MGAAEPSTAQPAPLPPAVPLDDALDGPRPASADPDRDADLDADPAYPHGPPPSGPPAPPLSADGAWWWTGQEWQQTPAGPRPAPGTGTAGAGLLPGHGAPVGRPSPAPPGTEPAPTPAAPSDGGSPGQQAGAPLAAGPTRPASGVRTWLAVAVLSAVVAGGAGLLLGQGTGQSRAGGGVPAAAAAAVDEDPPPPGADQLRAGRAALLAGGLDVEVALRDGYVVARLPTQPPYRGAGDTGLVDLVARVAETLWLTVPGDYRGVCSEASNVARTCTSAEELTAEHGPAGSAPHRGAVPTGGTGTEPHPRSVRYCELTLTDAMASAWLAIDQDPVFVSDGRRPDDTWRTSSEFVAWGAVVGARLDDLHGRLLRAGLTSGSLEDRVLSSLTSSVFDMFSQDSALTVATSRRAALRACDERVAHIGDSTQQVAADRPGPQPQPAPTDQTSVCVADLVELYQQWIQDGVDAATVLSRTTDGVAKVALQELMARRASLSEAVARFEGDTCLEPGAG